MLKMTMQFKKQNPSVREVLSSISPSYNVRHPKYGSSLAPLPAKLIPSVGEYQHNLSIGFKLRRQRPLSELDEMVSSVENFKSKVMAFVPLMKEADAHDLKTVTAMGVRPVTHHQVDEGRDVGSGFTIKFDQAIVAQIVNQWKAVADTIDRSTLSLAMPNGTNLGWPYPVSDTKDNLRTFLLGSIALAVETAKSKGWSLHDVMGEVEKQFGPQILMLGSRLQHTAKPIPACGEGRTVWTQNCEPRVRLVVAVSKLSVIYNRLAAKVAVATALKLRQHNQDRAFLLKEIDRWMKMPNTQTIAVDVSGFDNSVGSDNLVQILKMLAKISNTRPEDLIAEVSAPMLIPYQGSMFQTTSRVTPQLPSGASFTTACGLLMGDYVALSLAKIMGLRVGSGERDFEYLNWGDDFLIRCHKDIDVKKAFTKLSEHTGMEFDFEDTVKYLGFNYGSGNFEANKGYSFGRLLLKSVYPERPTSYPHSIIGYAARLQFVSDPELFHANYLKSFWSERMGPPFPFSELKMRFEEALVRAASLPVSQDDLNFLLHGLQPDEAEHLLSDLDVDFDFSEWIGGAYVPLADPEKAISDFAPKLLTQYSRFIPTIKNSGIPGLVSMTQLMAADFGWRGGRQNPYF